MSARGYVAVLFLCCFACADAQQISQYTQYVFNHFSINPAVAGSKDCLDARLGYRQQWVGFEGAPTTGWASLHGMIRAKDKPFVKNKHGVGIFVESDDTGPLGYTQLFLAYAYHMQMDEGYMLSMGLFGGLKQVKLDVGDIDVVNFNDPVLNNSSSVMVYPEVAPGIWLYGEKFWAGLSIFHALGNKVNGIGENTKLSRHFLLSSGYQARINKRTTITPSALMKFSAAAPMALDLNMMAEWRKVFGLGVSYRNTDAVAFMLKVGFLKYFTLGYSYDITTSKLRVSSSNTHEVILAINACPRGAPAKRAIFCPAFD